MAREKAKELGNCVVITKDDIRFAMGADYGKGIKVKESKVLKKRDELIMDAVAKGMNIISADTNCQTKINHIANMKSLLFPKFQNDYEFEVVNFMDTPLETLLERASKTDRKGGSIFWTRVVEDQAKEYLPTPFIKQDENLPRCVISDHDGTICHVAPTRSFYSGVGSEADTKNEIVCEYLQLMKMMGYKIIILSGLEDIYRSHRENWLQANNIEYDALYMRKGGDHRKDWIIKDELFKEHIEGKYYIHSILDDRPQMNRYWVSKGYSQRLLSIGNQFKEF